MFHQANDSKFTVLFFQNKFWEMDSTENLTRSGHLPFVASKDQCCMERIYFVDTIAGLLWSEMFLHADNDNDKAVYVIADAVVITIPWLFFLQKKNQTS